MLVVCVSSKRYKISTQCQVVPSYWDNVRECPLISVNEEMNEHNQRVYEQLTLIKKEVNGLFSILQKGDETINVQREIEKIMAKRKAKESRKEEINIEAILREGFRKMYAEKQANREVKESTLNQQKTTLNKLIENIKNIEGYNKIEFLSQDGYEDLKEYLCETNGITKYQSEQCRMYAEIMNYIHRKRDYRKYPITYIHHIGFGSQKNFKDALTDDEVLTLENVELDNEMDNYARYLFLIECECGQRYSDIKKIIDNPMNAGELAMIETKKYGVIASVYFTDKLLEYIKKLPNIQPTRNTYRLHLKKIAKDCKLNRPIKGFQNKPLCEVISSHFGRHTFITNMCRKGYSYSDICDYSGHKSDDVVKKVYAHINEEDKKKQILAKRKKIEGSNEKNNQYVQDIEEAKNILAFLGVDVLEYQDEKDFSLLMAMIGRKEGELIAKLGIENVTPIKEIFNEKKTLKERANKLRQLREIIIERE